MTLPRKFNFTLAGARRRRRARRASSARRLRLPSHGRNAFNWPWSGSLKENLPVEDRRPETRSATRNGAREMQVAARVKWIRAIDDRRKARQSSSSLAERLADFVRKCSRNISRITRQRAFGASAIPNSWRFIGDTRQRIRDSPGNER